MAFYALPARRVTAALRRGSSLPVVVDTASGTFVVKLSGAAQGTPALIAEVIVAELAEALGLPVHERAFIELEDTTPSDDRNDELADLLRSSVGLNLGLRYLSGAQEWRASDAEGMPSEFAVRVLWLDGLVMNPDRTPHNPNILLWKKQPWLIDHGASLTFQYDWSSVTEQQPREPYDLSRHLFASRAPLL